MSSIDTMADVISLLNTTEERKESPEKETEARRGEKRSAASLEEFEDGRKRIKMVVEQGGVVLYKDNVSFDDNYVMGGGVLGEGGYGTVYEGWRLGDNREVAIEASR